MTDVKIKNLSKKQANYFKEHLQEEHPVTRGRIELSNEQMDDLDITDIGDLY